MFVKMKNKRGFSLIEMMVVIAIIAILVGIVTPVVGRSTTKSNAATNAANLRSVKAQVAALMAQGQISYDTATNNSTVISELDQRINEADAAGNSVLAAFLRLGRIAIEGVSYINEISTRLNNTYYGTEDGTIVIDGTTLPAPLSKSVKIDGLTLRKNTTMTVSVSANDIVVTYGGITIDTFAVIAEYGDEASEHLGEVDHNFIDGNNDGSCDVCGDRIGEGEHSNYSDAIGDVIGNNQGNAHTCEDTDGDCLCDINECGLPVHTDADGNGHCDGCAALTSAGEHFDNDCNGNCDVTGCTGTVTIEHDYDKVEDSDPAKHKCSKCGKKENCNEKGGGNSCTVCGGTCITPDTLITLVDGTQKRVDELTEDDILLVWNHHTGSFDGAPVAYIIDHNKQVAQREVIRLMFSNGTEVKIIGEHVFFDVTENKYVAVTTENAETFIGHEFVGMTGIQNELEKIELVKVERTIQETEIYEVTSYKHLTCFTNNVLSACAYIDGMLNAFDIDPETLAYDTEKMNADIEKYGLLDYAFLAPFISENVFQMHNCETLTVAVGKNTLDMSDIFDLIDMYYTFVK